VLFEYLVPVPFSPVHHPPKYGESAGPVALGRFLIFFPWTYSAVGVDVVPVPASNVIVQYFIFSGSIYC
jgi:hypothetical protein